MPRVVRREDPPSFPDFRLYKPLLRVDFKWNCCYCGVREPEWGGQSNFAVEHFRPKSLFPELETVYSNLYYACQVCNRYKWKTWPSQDDLASGRRFFDVCSDRSIDHFRVVSSGELAGLSACGEYTIRRIRLNREVLVRLRRRRTELRHEYGVALRQIRDLQAHQGHAGPVERPLIARLLELYESYVSEIKSHFAREPMD